MLKKILTVIFAFSTLFIATAHAEKAKSKFFDEASLCVTNHSNTMVRVTEGIFPSYHYFAPHTHEDIYPFGFTLFDVEFKYLASDGSYYPIQNCYFGDLHTDLTVTVYNSPYYPYYPYCVNMW